jgi:hypothetical protein
LVLLFEKRFQVYHNIVGLSNSGNLFDANGNKWKIASNHSLVCASDRKCKAKATSFFLGRKWNEAIEITEPHMKECIKVRDASIKILLQLGETDDLPECAVNIEPLSRDDVDRIKLSEGFLRGQVRLICRNKYWRMYELWMCTNSLQNLVTIS